MADAPSAPPKGGGTGVSFRSVMICHRVVVCPQASRPRVHIAPAPIGRRAAGRGLQDPATLMPMTGDGPQIVIKGRREDWPGGARTLTPREPGREPNRQTFWFGSRARPGRQPGVVPDHFGGRPPDAGGRRRGPRRAPGRRPPRVADAGPAAGARGQPLPGSDDKHGTREYRSPDGAWRVVRTRRPGGSRNARPRWEVHERCEGRGAGWRHHAAFERRRDALVFLDTTAAASGGESVTTAPARRRETPEPSQEPPQSSPRRTPKGPITHDLDETRSQDIPWSLCGVLLYDPRQIAKEGEPATCGKCQRFQSATSYRKRQAAMKAAKKET